MFFFVWEAVTFFGEMPRWTVRRGIATQRPVVGAAAHARARAFPSLKSVDDVRPEAHHRAVVRRRDTRNMMDKVEMIADALGVPVVALVPIALVAVAVLAFVLDGLSHTILKPFKSPPVIATLPLVGGMAEFLKGPIGLMAKAMPKYGEVFTGASPPPRDPRTRAPRVVNRRPCDRPSRIRRSDPNAPRDLAAAIARPDPSLTRPRRPSFPQSPSSTSASPSSSAPRCPSTSSRRRTRR